MKITVYTNATISAPGKIYNKIIQRKYDSYDELFCVDGIVFETEQDLLKYVETQNNLRKQERTFYIDKLTVEAKVAQKPSRKKPM